MGIIGRVPEILERSAGRFGKPILVHYHIYKNAGTSVEKNLAESFGEKWALFEGAPEKTVVSNDEVAAFAEANPNISAISSHKARPFPAVKGFFPILFLRHPIDRARSMYRFARRNPAQADHAVARDGSFKDYVNYWSDLSSSVLRNYQVAHLSQASFRVPDLWRAVATAGRFRGSPRLLELASLFWPRPAVRGVPAEVSRPAMDGPFAPSGCARFARMLQRKTRRAKKRRSTSLEPNLARRPIGGSSRPISSTSRSTIRQRNCSIAIWREFASQASGAPVTPLSISSVQRRADAA